MSEEKLCSTCDRPAKWKTSYPEISPNYGSTPLYACDEHPTCKKIIEALAKAGGFGKVVHV